MASAPVTQPVGRSAVRYALAQISLSYDQFERFSSRLFDEFDALSAELLRRQKAWQSERQSAEGELRQRAAQLEQERAALAAARERLREEIEREVAEANVAKAGQDERLQQLMAQADQERAGLQAAREAVQAHAAQLAQAAAELAEARKETQRQREKLEALESQSTDLQPSEALHEQLHQVERERAACEQERAVLESELEAVRGRAAEMVELLAQQKQQMEDSRSQGADELKRIRRLLETLTQRQIEQDAESKAGATAPPEAVAAATAPQPQAGDPVLDSVMAQFQMLQRDLARRRRTSQTS